MSNSTDKELIYLKREINNWFYGDGELLNVLGRPLQSNKILYNLINRVLYSGGSVIYIWGKSYINKELVSHVKNGEKCYAYTREDNLNKNLIFMNYKYLYNLNQKYDLIVIDDVSTYLNLSIEKFPSLYKKLRKLSNKILLYSSIPYCKDDELLNALNLEDKGIFTEPRIITTRIDLKNDIPYVLYEYLLWFKNNKKNVITYVPYKEDVEGVYSYYRNMKDLKDLKIIKSNEEKINKNVFNFKDKSIFLITNNMEEVIETPNVHGIIVLSADDSHIDYKKIVFMCSKVSYNHNNFAEVILVCNEESEDIEISKDITRKFNKKLWEKHYLTL